MKTATVPVFAVIGHPNEGKSSVLSTLAEDDSVAISPVPGETRECQAFPVLIDGREMIRFIDTPGFQNPLRTLRWMQAYDGPARELVAAFIRSHRDDPAFRDDCALLMPVREGAGIIFVVDGSRPMRRVDQAEMEILRLTGCPRMAVINAKAEDDRYLETWQHEFRRHFNVIRVFNSVKATYGQRIRLLESLKAIDPDLEDILETVIRAFQEDWARRTAMSAEEIMSMVQDILGYRRERSVSASDDEAVLKAKLLARFMEWVHRRERRAQEAMRRLYKHNLFRISMPPHSLLQEDLFCEKTWEFLGLSSRQLAMAAAMGGAALGGGLDALTLGSSFGLFAAAGGVLGAASAWFGGRDLLGGSSLLGFRLDHERLRIGPVQNMQLLPILIDRALLFYAHVVNWAHGRRDYPQEPLSPGKKGLTAHWDGAARKKCVDFFRAIQQDDQEALFQARQALKDQLIVAMEEIVGCSR